MSELVKNAASAVLQTVSVRRRRIQITPEVETEKVLSNRAEEVTKTFIRHKSLFYTLRVLRELVPSILVCLSIFDIVKNIILVIIGPESFDFSLLLPYRSTMLDKAMWHMKLTGIEGKEGYGESAITGHNVFGNIAAADVKVFSSEWEEKTSWNLDDAKDDWWCIAHNESSMYYVPKVVGVVDEEYGNSMTTCGKPAVQFDCDFYLREQETGLSSEERRFPSGQNEWRCIIPYQELSNSTREDSKCGASGRKYQSPGGQMVEDQCCRYPSQEKICVEDFVGVSTPVLCGTGQVYECHAPSAFTYHEPSKCTSPDGEGGFDCCAGQVTPEYYEPETCADGYVVVPTTRQCHNDESGTLYECRAREAEVSSGPTGDKCFSACLKINTSKPHYAPFLNMDIYLLLGFIPYADFVILLISLNWVQITEGFTGRNPPRLRILYSLIALVSFALAITLTALNSKLVGYICDAWIYPGAPLLILFFFAVAAWFFILVGEDYIPLLNKTFAPVYKLIVWLFEVDDAGSSTERVNQRLRAPVESGVALCFYLVDFYDSRANKAKQYVLTFFAVACLFSVVFLLPVLFKLADINSAFDPMAFLWQQIPNIFLVVIAILASLRATKFPVNFFCYSTKGFALLQGSSDRLFLRELQLLMYAATAVVEGEACHFLSLEEKQEPFPQSKELTAP